MPREWPPEPVPCLARAHASLSARWREEEGVAGVRGVRGDEALRLSFGESSYELIE
jgi:hypothetical protein